jgi:hypothetical protein
MRAGEPQKHASAKYMEDLTSTDLCSWYAIAAYSSGTSVAIPNMNAHGPQRTNMFIKIYIINTNQWLYLTTDRNARGLCCVRGIP